MGEIEDKKAVRTRCCCLPRNTQSTHPPTHSQYLPNGFPRVYLCEPDEGLLVCEWLEVRPPPSPPPPPAKKLTPPPPPNPNRAIHPSPTT